MRDLLNLARLGDWALRRRATRGIDNAIRAGHFDDDEVTADPFDGGQLQIGRGVGRWGGWLIGTGVRDHQRATDFTQTLEAIQFDDGVCVIAQEDGEITRDGIVLGAEGIELGLGLEIK